MAISTERMGYSRTNSAVYCASMWFGTTWHGLAAKPSRRSSMLATTHDRGLAGADHVEQPGVAGLHDAPDGVPLVGMQFEAAGEPRQLQVRAVELALARSVEQVVVDPAQPLAALRVLEGPGREALLEQAQLLARRQRLVGLLTT